MTPKKPRRVTEKQEDFFKTKLEYVIDLEHELARLANIIAWEKLEREYGHKYHESIGRPGRTNHRSRT